MVRYYFRFTGRVQGVGFRFFVSMNAEKCKVTGWVRNLPDGSVEAEAQGIPAAVEGFLEMIQNDAHRFIRIDHVEKEKRPLVEKESKFRVAY